MRQALELALEALEGVLDDAPKVLEASIAGGLYEVIQCRDAITAIKEALAQPEQEPVVWMYQDKSTHEVRFQKHMRDFVDHSKTSEMPLYSEPLANYELQCVCGAVWCGDEMVHLPNKIPPQRKPLTDEEILDVARNHYNPHQRAEISFARAIEEALMSGTDGAQPEQKFDTHAVPGKSRDTHSRQLEQEPVAWTLLLTGENNGLVGKAGKTFEGSPEYYRRVDVYTTPPQRTWVGLTDEEIDQGLLRSDYAFKTAEAWRVGVVFAMTKLKEKNT